MLAIEIELLTGCYRATAFNDRRRAEWPIHPARVYSALVAALDDARDEEVGSERRALDQLASLTPPEVWATAAHFRTVLDHYVPVNDLTALSSLDRYLDDLGEKERALAAATDPKEEAKCRRARDKAVEKLRVYSDKSVAIGGKGSRSTAVQLIPGNQQSKQPRTFPVVWPYESIVHLVWPSESLEGLEREALDRIASRVARIGHSSSLVRLSVADECPELGMRKRWRPGSDGALSLRVPLEDQRMLLEREHMRHQQVDARILPYRPQSYTSDEETRAGVVSGPFVSDAWIIYKVVPPPGKRRRRLLDLSRAEELARAFRGALMKASDGKLPEVLSGHNSDGNATTKPHLAFVPLADVGHQWATGSILGLALIPPRRLVREDFEILTRALAKLEDEGPLVLRTGRQVAVHVQRTNLPDVRATLRERTWTGPATRWASVSAVALDRNPGPLNDRDPEVVHRAVESAEAVVAESCVNVGLPRPLAVFIHKRSLVDGAPSAQRFMPFPRSGKGLRRVCVHVELIFDVPVRGPLLLGAGRYFGVGLFRPMTSTHV